LGASSKEKPKTKVELKGKAGPTNKANPVMDPIDLTKPTKPLRPNRTIKPLNLKAPPPSNPSKPKKGKVLKRAMEEETEDSQPVGNREQYCYPCG